MELVRMSQIRSPSGWAIMYSESHYACFGCQRALAPADPRRAPKKDGAGQFGRTRLFFTLCQVEQSNRRPRPLLSTSSTLTRTRPPTLGAPPPPVFGLYKDLVKMTAGGTQVPPKKKSKWMKKTFRKLVVQPSSRDVLERPGNAVEGALGARPSKSSL